MSTLSCMSVPSGWVVDGDGSVNHIKEVQEDDDGHIDEFGHCGQKRKRVEAEMGALKLCVSKKGRKRVEDRVSSEHV